jgi:hypothetical protein
MRSEREAKRSDVTTFRLAAMTSDTKVVESCEVFTYDEEPGADD